MDDLVLTKLISFIEIDYRSIKSCFLATRTLSSNEQPPPLWYKNDLFQIQMNS